MGTKLTMNKVAVTKAMLIKLITADACDLLCTDDKAMVDAFGNIWAVPKYMTITGINSAI